MKLNWIKLQDFRCFDELEMTFDKPINFIFGPNGSGKSSIASAIALALTGKAAGIGKNKPQWNRIPRGKQRLTRHGARGYRIRVKVDGQEIESRPDGASPGPQELARRFSVSKEALFSLFDTARFLSLHPDDKKRVIFDLMDIRVTGDNIRERLAAWVKKPCPVKSYFTGEGTPYSADELLTSLHKIPGSLEEGYDLAYEQRRLTKRELKALGPPASQDLPSPEAVRDKIGSLKNEITSLHTSLGQARGTAIGEKRHLEAELGEVKELLEHLELKARGISPTAQSHRLSKLRDQRKEVSEYLKALNGDMDYLRKQINALELKKAQKEALYKRLEAFDGTCPLLDGTICRTQEVINAAATIIDELQREEKSLVVEQEKLQQALKETADLIKESDEKLRRTDAEISECQDLIERHKELKQRIRDLNNKKQDIEQALTFLDEGKVRQSQAIRERIALLEAELERQQDLLTLARNEEKRKALEEKRKKLEILTQAFSPKGIMADLLTGACATLNRHLAEAMERISGARFSLETSINETMDFYLKQAGHRTAVELASSSERFRAGIVTQYVLSNLTGLRFMLIDGLDILDQQNKGFFFDFIQEVKGEFDTILVFCTIGQYAPRNPGLPDTDFWMLRHGQVMRIPQEIKQAA